MTCDSLGLWLLSLVGVLLIVCGVLSYLYGRACERLRSHAELEDTIREIGDLDSAWGDLRQFLKM